MSSFNSAYGAAHLPSPTTRLHGVWGKKDHASIHLRWPSCGSATPPGCEVSGEENDLTSFPNRPFLMQFAIDVLAVFVAFTLIATSCIGFGFAVFALLFLRF